MLKYSITPEPLIESVLVATQQEDIQNPSITVLSEIIEIGRTLYYDFIVPCALASLPEQFTR